VPEISPSVAITTIVVLGLIGMIAGFFPARRASRCNPIEALKL
jgi:putative ABC transport system permease protein